jgi:DNA-binding NarL/FixJ family response regulator
MTIDVFLADDHAIVREGLQHILDAQPDIRVVGQAPDGQTAIDGVVHAEPDVAVLDISMPPPSGVEAARRIRETCPSTQIVVLSMLCSMEHVSRALKAGCLGYVLKECAGAELVQAVRAVHGGHSYMSQRVSDVMLQNFVDEDQGGCPLAELSDREREVFHLVIEGLSSTEIGDLLTLSPKTIETYRSRIHRKLGTHDVPELIKFAIRHDIISIE